MDSEARGRAALCAQHESGDHQRDPNTRSRRSDAETTQNVRRCSAPGALSLVHPQLLGQILKRDQYKRIITAYQR